MDIIVWLGVSAIIALVVFLIVKRQSDEFDRQCEIQRAQAIRDAHIYYEEWKEKRLHKLKSENELRYRQSVEASQQTRSQSDNTMMDNVLGYVVADTTGIPINFTPGAIVGMMTHASHETSTTHHDASSSSDSISTSTSYDSSSSSSYDSGSSSSSGGDF